MPFDRDGREWDGNDDEPRSRETVDHAHPTVPFARLASGDSTAQRRVIPEVCVAFDSVGVAFNDEDAPGIRLRRGL
jgi:hypothetical protein